MVNSFSDVIELFNGPAAFGRAIGISAGAAKQAKRRNRLAPEHFEATIRAAQHRGLKEVTAKRLAELAAQHRRGAAQ